MPSWSLPWIRSWPVNSWHSGSCWSSVIIVYFLCLLECMNLLPLLVRFSSSFWDWFSMISELISVDFLCHLEWLILLSLIVRFSFLISCGWISDWFSIHNKSTSCGDATCILSDFLCCDSPWFTRFVCICGTALISCHYSKYIKLTMSPFLIMTTSTMCF